MANLNDRIKHVETVIAALETVLEGKATSDTDSYSIADRSISKMSPDELLRWRTKYYNELKSLQDSLALSVGGKISGRRISTRFV